MTGALLLGLALLGAAVLVANSGQATVAGIAAGDFASLAAFGGVAFVAASALIGAFRGRFAEGVRALLAWAAIGFVFVAGYTYRFELAEVTARIAGELAPGRTAVGPGGEVTVSRRADGSFVLGARVNDRDMRFIFDTGATTVVLTPESARAAGLNPDTLEYTVPVSTANGRTVAAPVILDRLTVGPITEQRVRALITRPGLLRENLLGMTFLERLGSYEVRNNRLILRGRGS
ncbi:MAG: CblY, a non-orthologous displasment for Alpha-ribazole-5'-phosphate phosphatase [uncultured Microvirga sp.]|uniref:CblY, a non-orthologous displasment for Alpha-ribazole-5'-phosphate phosphatase n=1 Tax=uncultured Microvirga sp. TaxID=412392 RepID=A0A6J4LE27_9HYPH|nr:MAG: CblY, a non-orthologous displasment for Alpha-ribazole-5'-phosphate phosphatase [uncultured Microvirga sp.]